MRLYRTFASLARPGAAAPRAVAIGVFDGLHIGHRAILERARSVAADIGGSSLVLTFEPTPKEFFSPDDGAAAADALSRALRAARRRSGWTSCSARNSVRCASSRREHSSTSCWSRACALGTSSSATIFASVRTGWVPSTSCKSHGRRHGIAVSEIPPVFCNGERVSSTAIRLALKNGDLTAARAMLGRDYSISGRVVRGLGFRIASSGSRRPT